MNKKYLLPIVITVLSIAGGGIYYYYYQCVETVTAYYKIVYIPSRLEKDIFGEMKYTDPKVDIEKIITYSNDSSAIASQTKEREFAIKFYAEELEKIANKKVTDAFDILDLKAQRSVLEDGLNELWSIVRVTHTRDFDLEEVKEIIKFWNDYQKVEEFNKKHKISVAIYQIC